MIMLINEIKSDFSTNKNFISRLFLCLLRLDRIKYIKYIIKPIRFIVINLMFNCEIPSTVKLNKGVRFPHPYNIIIHGDTKIGHNVTIYQGVTIGTNEFLDKSNAPTLLNDILIGANCVIVGPITIGNNVIISPNSMISKNIGNNIFYKIRTYKNKVNLNEYYNNRIK